MLKEFMRRLRREPPKPPPITIRPEQKFELKVDESKPYFHWSCEFSHNDDDCPQDLFLPEEIALPYGWEKYRAKPLVLDHPRVVEAFAAIQKRVNDLTTSNTRLTWK